MENFNLVKRKDSPGNDKIMAALLDIMPKNLHKVITIIDIFGVVAQSDHETVFYGLLNNMMRSKIWSNKQYKQIYYLLYNLDPMILFSADPDLLVNTIGAKAVIKYSIDQMDSLMSEGVGSDLDDFIDVVNLISDIFSLNDFFDNLAPEVKRNRGFSDKYDIFEKFISRKIRETKNI
jgi:hypothetical protein